MPKVIVDNTKNIQPERTYAMKTCPSCGSVIEIFESDILGMPVNENGYAQFECPCGKKLDIHKYFGGKQYGDKEYLKCVNHFQNQVTDALWNDLRYIPAGYRKEYLSLNHTELIISPLNVSLKIYIDRFEEGNWENRITENEFFKEYKFNLCLLSSDIDECARYSQALGDYIMHSMKDVCLQVKGDTDLKLQVVDNKELVAYFRNADVNIDQNEMDLAVHEKFLAEMKGGVKNTFETFYRPVSS